MKSLTLDTHGCPRASLRDWSSSSPSYTTIRCYHIKMQHFFQRIICWDEVMVSLHDSIHTQNTKNDTAGHLWPFS